MEDFTKLDADIFCLQETKLQEGQIELDLPGYYQYWNYAEKKGYSGTALFFVVSEKLKGRIKDACIHQEIMGSDHCPIELCIE